MAYDVIVLGLGACGAATTYQLAKRGAKVLGIDQFDPPHRYGSTYGDTRVTRLGIGEGAHYTPLAVRSHAIWREIETETGLDLLTTNGGLIISSADSVGIHGSAFFANTIAAARTHGIAYEKLDAAAIRGRFPQFAIDDGAVGYYEPSAGFVRPERCVAAQLALAKTKGGVLQRDERVIGFQATPSSVAVRTNSGVYEAGQLIIAAGPWLPSLLAPPLGALFKVYRQVLFWFDVEDVESFLPERFPIFIWELPRKAGAVYGFPALDGARGGIKIATESFESTTTPDTVRREVSVHEERAIHARFIAPFIRGVRPHCIRSVACLYTMTNVKDDFEFVIDRHPDFERVILASPCSGHGFKHSAAIGEALAQLALEGKSDADLRPFSLSRLLVQAP
jgi:sarcosine oxidase